MASAARSRPPPATWATGSSRECMRSSAVTNRTSFPVLNRDGLTEYPLEHGRLDSLTPSVAAGAMMLDEQPLSFIGHRWSRSRLRQPALKVNRLHDGYPSPHRRMIRPAILGADTGGIGRPWSARTKVDVYRPGSTSCFTRNAGQKSCGSRPAKSSSASPAGPAERAIR